MAVFITIPMELMELELSDGSGCQEGVTIMGMTFHLKEKVSDWLAEYSAEELDLSVKLGKGIGIEFKDEILAIQFKLTFDC
jgi:hypothetical protein